MGRCVGYQIGITGMEALDPRTNRCSLDVVQPQGRSDSLRRESAGSLEAEHPRGDSRAHLRATRCGLPARELPDLRKARTFVAADLGKGGHRSFEVNH